MDVVFIFVLLATRYFPELECADPTYTSSPGVQRTYLEASATFSWRLDMPLDSLAVSSITLSFENYNNRFYTNVSNTVDWPIPGYEERTTVSYTADRRGIGFTLMNIQLSDADGPYGCDVRVVPENFRDNVATLFIYGTPSVPTIQSSPADAVEGVDFSLTCSSNSSSNPVNLSPGLTYTWTRDDQPLPMDRHSTSGSGDGRLDIRPASRDDHGKIYTCTAREINSTLNNTNQRELNLQFKPGDPALEGPSTTLVEGFSELELTCTLSSDQAGNPASYNYRFWNTESSFTRTQAAATLTVPGIQVTVVVHDGLWRCEVSNTVGSGGRAEVTVDIDAPAQITQQPAPALSVLYNESFSAPCEVRGKPGALITWSYNGGDLPSGVLSQPGDNRADGKYTISTSTLQSDSRATEAEGRQSGGTYRCHGDNGVGNAATSIPLVLAVLYGPVGITLHPSEPITAVEGDHVSVTCTSDCSPSCSYTWSRSSDGWTRSGQTLDMSPINRNDHATYTCQSRNDHGSRTDGVSVTVNFAAEITSFTSSASDIMHGDLVTLRCDVTSRPVSIITIQMTTALSSMTDSYDEYVFDSISILDSGVYSCSATNGINQTPDIAEKHLDIQGGFHHCDTDSSKQNRTTGVGLNNKVEESICQFANPFYNISRTNWTFEAVNITRTDSSIHEDVMIDLQATEHVYIKHIIFTIPAVSPSHYGTYTLTSSNQHGTNLIFTLSITPKGPPEVPYELVCTRTTAVSLYLQWVAGYHGGSEQTFLVKFTNLGTGVPMTSEVDGGNTPRGNPVQHVLTESDGIEPGQTYEMQVDARNEHGTTVGPRITNSTLARPEFIGDPAITIDGNTAYIDWTLSNPESLSHIVVSACDTSDVGNCVTTNITNPRLQPYQVVVPAADSFMFAFVFYDGEVRVNEFKHGTPIPGGSSNLTIIVGAVVGVVVAAALVVLLVMLWRKGIFVKKQTSKPEKAVYYENMTVGIVGGVEQENRTHTDVQYEDVGNLAFSSDGTDTKVYEGLIGEEINKTPVVYEAYEGDKTEVVQYRPSDIRPGDVISHGAVFYVQAAVILRGRHKEKARKIVTKQIVATNAEMFKRYLVEAARVLTRLVKCEYVVVCAGMAGDSLLMENMPLGNLRQNLKGMADHVYANTADVKQKECLGFVRQIIAGLKAIMSQKPSSLFYCLSTDHVLVGQGQVCKLMGFNTADCVRQREQWEQQQGTPRPVRWLAPEAIDLRHVPESDIWAFGVLVWEILNFGLEPYIEYEDQQVVDFVKRGHRQLEMPPPTPTDICDLVTHCWMISPTKRPSIMEITDVLDEIHI